MNLRERGLEPKPGSCRVLLYHRARVLRVRLGAPEFGGRRVAIGPALSPIATA